MFLDRHVSFAVDGSGNRDSCLSHSCSSITLNLLASQVAPDAIRHVSLTLNVTYHAPAVL